MGVTHSESATPFSAQVLWCTRRKTRARSVLFSLQTVRGGGCTGRRSRRGWGGIWGREGSTVPTIQIGKFKPTPVWGRDLALGHGSGLRSSGLLSPPLPRRPASGLGVQVGRQKRGGARRRQGFSLLGGGSRAATLRPVSGRPRGTEGRRRRGSQAGTTPDDSTRDRRAGGGGGPRGD